MPSPRSHRRAGALLSRAGGGPEREGRGRHSPCAQSQRAGPASAASISDGVEIWRLRRRHETARSMPSAMPQSAMRAVRAAVRAASGTRVLHSNFPLQGVALAFGRAAIRPHLPRPGSSRAAPRTPGPVSAAELTAAAVAGRSSEAATAPPCVVRAASSCSASSCAGGASRLGARAERITLIPGGIDTVRFSPGAPVGHPWAGAMDHCMFTARRTGASNGSQRVGRGVRADDAPGSRCAAGCSPGAGPLEDRSGPRRALGVAQQVAMLGRVSDEELVGWYRAADLVIMPTQELEGFGLTTAEALACGTVGLARQWGPIRRCFVVSTIR